jgi:membrane protein YqaA with SNARE-associated domain
MDALIESYGLWGLFASAFISSTILPGGSEAVLAALALHSHHSMSAMLIAATAGNTLGGMSSWLIGYLIAKRWPATQMEKPAQQRAVGWLHRYGSPILLLSWLPVVGDPLCVAAGWLRINVWLSLLMIAAGKAARYAVILLLLS